jgi:hypothetical protein
VTGSERILDEAVKSYEIRANPSCRDVASTSANGSLHVFILPFFAKTIRLRQFPIVIYHYGELAPRGSDPPLINYLLVGIVSILVRMFQPAGRGPSMVTDAAAIFALASN